MSSESFTYVPNPNWFSEFEVEAQPNQFLLAQATALRDATLRNEPVVTGQVEELEASLSDAEAGPPGEARFYPHAIWNILEFGTVNNPPYRPITRGADQLNLKLVWGG